MPALSPDGKKLAFVWRGDIWVSAADGGRAYRVTDHVDLDAYPVFSPDGNWIAFSSTRTGNWDIFVVPATGGEARQITFSSDAEQVSDWSPDGKNLLFTAGRDLRGTGIFAADVQSGRTTLITEDYEPLRSPAYSPDGKRVAYGRGGAGFPWTRPRYHGSGAAQLWEAGGGGTGCPARRRTPAFVAPLSSGRRYRLRDRGQRDPQLAQIKSAPAAPCRQ